MNAPHVTAAPSARLPVNFNVPATIIGAGGAIRELGGTIARAMTWARETDPDETAAHALVDGLVALNQRLNIPRLRDDPRIDAERFSRPLEKMANDALASGSPQNNPVVPTSSEVVELYRAAW